MFSLHRKCGSAIEQRGVMSRCSIAFWTPILASVVCGGLLAAPNAHAQATLTRPISKPALPQAAQVPVATPPVAIPSVVLRAVEPEFRSVSNLPAILYDAPSVKAKKLSIFSALTPLEVLARTDRWLKVRDAVGEMGWVETSVLTEKRLVAVTATIAQIRAAAASAEPITFEAERGVVLEMIGVTQDGWLAVRHRDGNAGFVLRSQVFGY